MRKANCSYSQIETVLRFCSKLKIKWIGAKSVLRGGMIASEGRNESVAVKSRVGKSDLRAPVKLRARDISDDVVSDWLCHLTALEYSCLTYRALRH